MNITSPTGAKYNLQKDIQVWTVQKMLTSSKKKSQEPVKRRQKGKSYDRSTTLPLRNSDQQQEVHHGSNFGI